MGEIPHDQDGDMGHFSEEALDNDTVDFDSDDPSSNPSIAEECIHGIDAANTAHQEIT
jgi:hypothetical protein